MAEKKIAITYPKHQAKLMMTVSGVFAFPEQWKITDEGNPGMFTYKVKMGSLEIEGGKIVPKQLTQKQLRQQEQSKKKGGKKQTKKQQNPGEAQKLRQELQREEQEERKREQEFNKLSEQEQFYHINEDPYKSALLQFQNNTIEQDLSGKKLVIFQERVTKDKGEWVYVYKLPTANEEELAKLKKSKPKNLNANDLNPVCMRAWVDLEKLASETEKEVQLRCKVEQVDKNEESPTPNLEKTYVKIKVFLNAPLISKKDQFTAAHIIKQPKPPKEDPPSIKCVTNLKNQLRLGMESLAMEYSSMFWKQLNSNEEQKQANVFGGSKKNEHMKRKEQFLYDFNVSGKYKILKERLKKHIVWLCENKYAAQMNGAKSFTGITCSVRDQFYSEIYNFLVTSYSETMKELVEENRQKWQQVEVLNKETQKSITREHLSKFRPDESIKERITRNVAEHRLLGGVEYGKELYEKELLEDPQNFQLKYEYSVYCLKNGLKGADDPELIKNVEDYLSHNRENQQVKLFYVLLLVESQKAESLQKAWVILRELINIKESKPPAENSFDQIAQYLYSTILFQLSDQKDLSDKYEQIIARKYLRSQGKINAEASHKQNPSASQIPSIDQLAKYEQEMTDEERDSIWLKVSAKFLEFGLIKSLGKALQKIQNKETNQFKKLQVGMELIEKNYEKVLQTLKNLYGQSQDSNLLPEIILCLLKLKQNEEAEKYLKISLKVSSSGGKINALFLLGKLYLDMGKYGNAKACLTKYLEAAKDCAGGLSWKLLGIAENKLGCLEEAVECLRFANLNDPKDANIWLALAEVEAGLGNYVMVNQCLNSYEHGKSGGVGEQQHRKIEQMISILNSKKGQNYYQERIRQSMQERLTQLISS